MTRIYVPANAAMLRALAETGELKSAGPVHLVTRMLRESHPDTDIEDLEYTAFDDAALASLGLLVGQAPRRVVVSADVQERLLAEHRTGTGADLHGTVQLKKVAAIHVDDADAAAEIAQVLASPEPDASAVEAHYLDWYAPSELDEVLSALGSSSP
ncbi:hypothetical protein L0U85_10350 [Glycomyces sp. L485]|uniref:DUF6912 family protein n=1 Tax=Glycomyces sp. L485 TaxID=2909235 RepID=UPI001F4B8463|nr:hypothetical protein [Glycomyces sp. L485]MCH7231249.1 hypothetical protein [Glycomyces sp. L485]